MIIAFAGHSFVSSRNEINEIKEMVKEQIRHYISDERSVACYLGGYGEFDELCASACRELKQEHAGIKVIYVSPYMTPSEQAKIKDMQKYGLYDSSIYPPIENVPLRLAILKRNEWMMTVADLVIVYINHGYGGAYKSLQAAKRKKKKIINLCDFL